MNNNLPTNNNNPPPPTAASPSNGRPKYKTIHLLRHAVSQWNYAKRTVDGFTDRWDRTYIDARLHPTGEQQVRDGYPMQSNDYEDQSSLYNNSSDENRP